MLKGNMMKIGIIGAGSFGVSLAKHLKENGNEVLIWANSKETKDLINEKGQSKYLPGVNISGIKASNSLKEVIDGASLIIHVTSSKYFRKVLQEYKEYVKDDQKIIICSKGIEKESKKTLEEVLKEELPNISYGVLSGPSHAEEVARNMETVIVCASEDEKLIKLVMEAFDGERIRIYGSKDVIGVALGGVLKNIIAVSAGIAYGLNKGDNALTAIITRGLVELSRFAEKLGADPKTIYGLSGLGDLIVTCLSEYSRNRKAGILLSKGYTKEEIEKELGMVVEGFDNIDAVYEMSKELNIDTPITDEVYKILHGETTADDAVKNLMTRKNKYE